MNIVMKQGVTPLEGPVDDGNPMGDLPAPEPVPNTAAYLHERELCLALSPQRRANYARYQNSSRRQAVVDYSPIRIDIENVSRCNFRCTMCQVSDWPKGKRGPDMSFADFKQLIDGQDGLVEIKIQGFGEPTMGGDPFYEMIRYARAQHIWVRTTTNASRLHLHDSYKKLVDSDANEIQISIDGATKEVFEGIRRGSVFERVVSNCKLINGYCEERGIIRTKMWVTVQKSNLHQLPELIDLAQDMKFKILVFSFDLNDFGTQRWRNINDDLAVGNLSRKSVDELLERARSKGINLSFWKQNFRFSTKDPKDMCAWPFERAYISSDMRVVPCCIIGNPDTSELGDARKFNETWNGHDMVEFRKAHLEGRVPEVCKSCYKA